MLCREVLRCLNEDKLRTDHIQPASACVCLTEVQSATQLHFWKQRKWFFDFSLLSEASIGGIAFEQIQE
jgi:hypothetical protein